MAKKKSAFEMGDYVPTQTEREAYIWCIRNKIFISPVAIREARWTIEISSGKSKSLDPNDYSKVNIWKKVYQYYKYYYSKHEK
tara:strand:+ start:146 stop:394 length:249 start_codon:yes stop_codon:yes gene_type:complete